MIGSMQPKSNGAVYRSLVMDHQPKAMPQQHVFGAGGFTQQPTQQLHKQQAHMPAFQKLSIAVVDQPSSQLQPSFPFEELDRTHCLCKASAMDTAHTVDTVLDNLELDFKFKSAKCKWKIDAFHQNARVSVRVYLYKHDNGAVHALEWQRRSGCAFANAALFESFAGALSNQGVLCDDNGDMLIAPAPSVRVTHVQTADARSSFGFGPPPLPPMLAKQVTELAPAMTSEQIKPFVEMASSNFLEPCLQGVEELATLAFAVRGRVAVASYPNIVLLLARLLHSPCEDVVRCTATALAGIAQCDQASHAAIAQSGLLGRLVEVISSQRKAAAAVSPSTIGVKRGLEKAFEMETKRMCARVLVPLCKPGCVSRHEVAKLASQAFFADVAAADDNRLCSYVMEARQALGAH